jgi:hypothetical protein
MTTSTPVRRPGPFSILMITASIAVSVAVSLAMDATLIVDSQSKPVVIVLGAVMFNAAAILQAVVGSIIEWQRPGHRIGRLLMLAGPLYALLGALWLTADKLEPAMGPDATGIVAWAGAVLSYAGVALIAGGIPLLFPTGTLPGPRWRFPVGIVLTLFAAGLAALATRPGPLADMTTMNPFGVPGWPSLLQVLIDLIWFDLLALFVLAVAGLVVRYRRGDRTQRLQVRWLAAAVALCLVGFAAVLVELRVRTEQGPVASTLIAYAGILAMPIAIGIAITRYRLYEIDRIISRTIGYAIVTGVLVIVFGGAVLGLQAVLEPLTGGNTVAVAASTLIVAALFQPLRRRIQSTVDRRFDRARYDGERTVAAFAARLRDQVELDSLETDLQGVVGQTVAPTSLGLWVRRSGADS